MTKLLKIALLTLVLPALLLVSANAQDTSLQEPTVLSDRQLMEQVDAKLDKLLHILGDPSGRANLSEVVQRNHNEIKKEVANLQNQMRKVERELRQLKR